MARLGAPVLTSTNGLIPFPQDDFLEWGQTPQAYFDQLERLLKRPVQLQTIARAFRWYNLFHLGASLNLGDLVPTYNFEGLPPFKLPREARTIEKIIKEGKDVLVHNWEQLRASQHPDSANEEQTVLTSQLRRFIHFFHTGEDLDEDFQLRMVMSDDEFGDFPSDPDQATNPGTRTMMVKGSHTQYFVDGKVFSRFSPMCARIAPLCAQHIMATASIQS